jgi:alkylation response protein AidB-like acyl-CoA dehydrogenase
LKEFRGWLDTHATRERVTELRGRNIGVLREWQAEMAQGGWAGIHWPVAFGGRDATFLEQVLYHSELAGRGLPPLVGNRGLSLVGPTIISHGTPEQQAKFLEATRRADILWASGMSEPNAGSDLASLRTRAEIQGSDVVVNGQKVWTSGAHYCDWLFTLVRTGPLVPKHAGISCVLIPLDTPGLTIRPIRRSSGDPEFNEIFFDDARVPRDYIVGPVDSGWKVARTTLSHEHSTNFLGAQQRQALFVGRLIDQLRRQEEAGAAIDTSLRRRLAQSWVNTQVLRLHGLKNVAKVATGGDPGAEGSILKVFGQEEEKRLYELAVDLRGSAGLTADRVGRVYLSSKAATIGGGTSEIHRNKIAERILGMPRDPWADD